MAQRSGAIFLYYAYHFLSYDAVVEMDFSFIREFDRAIFDCIYSIVSAHFYTSSNHYIGTSLAYDDRTNLRKAAVGYFNS